jgi:hypothetical protein
MLVLYIHLDVILGLLRNLDKWLSFHHDCQVPVTSMTPDDITSLTISLTHSYHLSSSYIIHFLAVTSLLTVKYFIFQVG